MKRKAYENITSKILDFLSSEQDAWDIPNAREYGTPVSCASTYGNAIRRLKLDTQIGVCQNGFDVCLYKIRALKRGDVRRLAAETFVYDPNSVDERANIIVDFLDSKLRCVEIIHRNRSVRATYDAWTRTIAFMGYRGQLRVSIRGHHLYLLKENRWKEP